jgi:phosphoribosyl 1,2-cyclic phosphodiesterase|uniref:MBL fold metallo-hydrolase n=1 Tax=Desulfobacca acetoxidans TaxID=60893 RepID=A0A7C3YXD8_9BACT
MEIRFWGTRGSIPAPGPATLEFGGNTTCLEVLLRSGRRVIIDGGTGIRLLGEHLKTTVATVRIYLLLTHNHWDHLIGLPFFFPLYREDSEIQVDGWPLAYQALKRVFDDHMGDGFFPVAFEQLRSHINFQNKIARSPVVLDDVQIDALPLNHPQGCLGFRFQEEGQTMVFITDNELGLDGGRRFPDFVKFVEGADLLIHDAQYLPEEISLHRGWGHSTYEEAVRLALEGGVKSLLLTHHDPARTDDQVRKIVSRAREIVAAAGSELTIDGAREGEAILLAAGELVTGRRLAASRRPK